MSKNVHQMIIFFTVREWSFS